MVALKRTEKERTESVVQAEIRLAVGSLPYVRLWRNNTGEGLVIQVGTLIGMLTSGKIAAAIQMLRAMRPVQFGLAVGSADLIGIVAPHGRLLSIEVKSEDGRVRPEQKKWAEMVERFGGVAGVARSVEEAMALVEKARCQYPHAAGART